MSSPFWGSLHYQVLTDLEKVTKSEYTIRDKHANTTNFYRVQQVNQDGQTSYSNIIKLDKSSNDNVFSIVHCAPNPFVDGLSVAFTIPETEVTIAKLYDIGGSVVWTKTLTNAQKGRNGFVEYFSTLPDGMYIFELQYGDQSLVKKLVKAK